MSTFYLVISTVLILVFFRVTRLLGIRSRMIQKVSPLLSILELILWTVIVFWSTSVFLSSRSYYPHLVIILAILFTLMVAWFYIKDIVAGFIFRVRHNPVKGQVFTCAPVHGSLRTLGLSQLTVETEEGQWVRVPYSSVVARTLSLQSPRQIVPGETTLELAVGKLDNPGKVERTLKKILAQSAWCVTSKPITIQMNPKDDNVRISFFLLDSSYLQLVKDRLTKAFGELKENQR